MKKILPFLLLLASALSVNAQTVQCKDTTYKVSSVQSGFDVNRYMLYEIVDTRDSTIYKTQCGKPCQIGIHKPHKVVSSVIQLPVYDSVPHYDTVHWTITVTIDSPGTKCDTIPDTLLTCYGLWGNGDNITQKNIDALKPYIKGWNDRIAWKDFNPAPGVYNWPVIDDAFDLLEKNNLAIGFMIYVGDNSPDFIYTAPYNVPKVLTSTGQTFPFYNDVTYNQLVQRMWLDVADHIKNRKITFWMSAEGSTGDEGSNGAGYKGTPVNPAYEISNLAWSDYRRSIWTYLKSITGIQLMINPGNKDRYGDVNWAKINIPGCWFKYGNAGHQFNLDGELSQITDNWQFISNDNKYRARTELENIDVNDPTYNGACATQQGFLALASNVDVFCIAAQRSDYITGLKYFNDFAGLRSATNTTKAFVYMSGGFDSTKHTAAELTAYKAAGATTGVGFWYDDIGADIMEGNYQRFMTMAGTSIPRFRIKSTGFGRYGKVLQDATFTLDPALKTPSKINVVIYDEAGDITINGIKFSGTNTKQERTLTVPFNGRSFKITGSLTTFLVSTE
jgi:hypothetical protein